MDKAVKTLNLYSGKGPLAEAAVDTLRDSLSRYLEEHERLDLEVSAQGLVFEGDPLEPDSQPAPYYFYLFKDGVRELSFLSGIGADEVLKLLQILLDRHREAGEAGNVSDSDDDEDFREHDTVTMLWEADMQFVRYYAIDAYAAGEVFDPDRGMRRSLEEQVQDRVRPYTDDVKRMSLRSARPVSELSNGAAITPAQPASDEILKALSAEGENDEAFQMDRFAVVWARLVKTAPPEQLEGMAFLMVKTFEVWMGDHNWGALNRGLRLLQSLSSVEQLQPVVREIVRSIAQPERLDHLETAVLEVDPEEVGRVTSFFGALGQRSVQHLARMLADLQPGARCEAYAGRFNEAKWGAHNLHLARLRSTTSYIVQDAMKRLVPMRNLAVVSGALRALLTRPEVEMRYEALRALEGDQDPATRTAIVRALSDGSRDLRALAIKTLGESRESWSIEALRERVEGKDFKNLQSTERRLLLTSYAKVADTTALDWFDDELSRQSLFGGKKLREWQEELQRALREAGTPQTRALLGGEYEGAPAEELNEP
ncbi:MAG: HEAT repeat domain-containing protein [Myxococcota bacterium]